MGCCMGNHETSMPVLLYVNCVLCIARFGLNHQGQSASSISTSSQKVNKTMCVQCVRGTDGDLLELDSQNKHIVPLLAVVWES